MRLSPLITTTRARYFAVALLIGLFNPLNSYGHQPVMDEAPRWEGGYGFQFRFESFGSDDLLDDDSKQDNPLGLSRYVDKTWFEGVYTFDRSKRITFKLPYIKQRRRVALGNSSLQQSSEGVGDLILGVPLKLYENKVSYTSNFSFTPSIRLPTGSTSGDLPISDGSLDFGVSFAYSGEDTKYYQLYDFFYWRNTNGKEGLSEGDEAGVDINWGYRFFTDDRNNIGATIIWDIASRHNERGDSRTTGASGGSRVHTGPVLVVFKNNIIFRAEYRFPVYENMIGTSLSRGSEFNIGIGAAF